MAREEQRKAEYDWGRLVRETGLLRRGYDSKGATAPLVLKKKQYLENSKIIERGLLCWECVRRNKRFLALYEKDSGVLEFGRKFQLTPDISKDDIAKDVGRIKIKKNKDGSVRFVNKSHEHKYTAYFYFLKNLGRAEFLNNSPVKSKQLHALVYDFLGKKDTAKISTKEISKFISQIPKQVDFIIDLGYTKQEIMREFEKQIDMWFSLFDATGDRNTKRALDYANITRYLKVYDLKNGKPKTTFSDIAQQLYPGPSNKNLDSAIQQVKREYKRAKELINGGFIFIK